MVVSNEELASKIIYLKRNHYIPNLDKESLNVRNAIESFYFCSNSVIYENNFWFRLTFCNYQVSDEFVREVNREFKRFQILNIGKDEF